MTIEFSEMLQKKCLQKKCYKRNVYKRNVTKEIFTKEMLQKKCSQMFAIMYNYEQICTNVYKCFRSSF